MRHSGTKIIEKELKLKEELLKKREKSLRSKEYLLARSVAQHMLQLVREVIVRLRDLSEAERLSIDVLIADIHGHLSNLIYMANWCLVWCKFGATFYVKSRKISNDMRLHLHNIPQYRRCLRYKTVFFRDAKTQRDNCSPIGRYQNPEDLRFRGSLYLFISS